MSNAEVALILAASGSGSRFGAEIPKQFLSFEGRPLYLHSLERFSDSVGSAVLVVPADWVERVREEVRSRRAPRICVIAGAQTRHGSVERGLYALGPEVEFVLVHDAVRPFVSPALVGKVSEGMRRFDACIPVLPVSDTVKEIADGAVVRTIPRESLGLAQTPQGFHVALLRRAFEQSRADGVLGTDEASLVERLGARVHVVPGDPDNAKITWRRDLPGLTPPPVLS
ncbi:MAG: 2-C-methyl-D-erythritol 4-phosphate cytidylyltransferase [Acidobacteriota bacterium]